MSRIEMVVGVIDGDSFETDSSEHPVRLADVEAPERGEMGYGAAKLKLARLIRGKQVEIQPVTRDKYGRTVARVRVGGVSVNSEMQNLPPATSY